MKIQRLVAVLSGALISTLASFVSAQTTVFSDNFDSLDSTSALIGNDWLFQKLVFTDAGCVTYSGAYAYDQVDPQAAKNFNYNNVNGGTYPNYEGASLEAADNLISGTLSLGVREDNYAAFNPTGKSACHQSRIFKNTPITNPVNATYKIKAKTAFNRYGADTTNGAGSKTGVFLTIYDVNNGYSIVFSEYKDNSVSRADGVVNVEETFAVDFGAATSVLIQAGFYSQVNADTGAFALWDDLEVSYATGSSGGSGGGGSSSLVAGPDKVPTLPFGGLVALVALVGWLGLRKK
jgi:hypothetical protein